MNKSDNTTPPADDAWVEQLTGPLRQSERSLDYVVESKLAAARANAIAKAPGHPLRHRLNLAGTAIASIALCYLAVRTFQSTVAWNEDLSTLTTAQHNLQIEQSVDLPILSSTEDLEFFDSLDFIEWIEMQDLISG